MMTIHYACEFGSLEEIKKLVENGIDINEKNKKYLTPLHIAIIRGDYDIVKFLVDPKGGNALVDDNKVSVFSPMQPLFLAISQNKFEIFKLLIHTGANVNIKDMWFGDTLLHYAIRKKATDFINLLVSIGLNTNAKNKSNETPLMLAILNGNADTIKLLVTHGANVTIYHFNRSITLGNDEIIFYLLQFITDLNQPDCLGHTPLMYACFKERIDIIDKLIEKGSNVNVQSKTGHTALMYASSAGFTQTAKYLIDHKSNLNLETSEGDTALTLSIFSGHNDISKFLIGGGSNINHCTICGNTPFIIASMLNNIEMIKYLIKSKVEVNIKNKKGKTALDYIIKDKKFELAVYLMENDCKKGTRV